MVGTHAGGRYDGLMKAVWQQAGMTSSPPPAAVGLTLNADRLTLLASAPKAKAPSAIPYLSQARPLTPLSSLHATRESAERGRCKIQLMFVPGVGKASWEGAAHAVIEVQRLGDYAALKAVGLLLTASQPR